MVTTHVVHAVRVQNEHGTHAVVTQADDVIWLSDRLMTAAADPDRPRITGDIEVNGHTLTLGTPDHGLGQITYHITGHITTGAGTGFHVAKRQP